MLLKTILEHISASARTAPVVPSAGRGQFRREIGLSPRRLEALRAGRNLEVTLERTLVALKADEAGAEWFNQLNVAGGVGGGNGFNRAAVDLGRIDRNQGQLRLRLKELKRWTADDAPSAATEELFAYAAWLSVLRAKGLSPYASGSWPKITNVELQLIAPAEYFERHGGITAARAVLERAEAELDQLRTNHPELAGISIVTMPIALSARITAAEFVHCFDSRAIDMRIAQRSTAASALDVLRLDKVAELRHWFADALASANFN